MRGMHWRRIILSYKGNFRVFGKREKNTLRQAERLQNVSRPGFNVALCYGKPPFWPFRYGMRGRGKVITLGLALFN